MQKTHMSSGSDKVCKATNLCVKQGIRLLIIRNIITHTGVSFYPLTTAYHTDITQVKQEINKANQDKHIFSLFMSWLTCYMEIVTYMKIMQIFFIL